ncbi:hypothetical protein BKA93DRAFT_750707 [Sparassis latifolia]
MFASYQISDLSNTCPWLYRHTTPRRSSKQHSYAPKVLVGHLKVNSSSQDYLIGWGSLWQVAQSAVPRIGAGTRRAELRAAEDQHVVSPHPPSSGLVREFLDRSGFGTRRLLSTSPAHPSPSAHTGLVGGDSTQMFGWCPAVQDLLQAASSSWITLWSYTYSAKIWRFELCALPALFTKGLSAELQTYELRARSVSKYELYTIRYAQKPTRLSRFARHF